MIRALILSLALVPGALSALTLDVPGNPVLALEQVEDPAQYALPIGPWRNGALPTRMTEGEVTRQVWRLDGPGVATLQIAAPLRAQLTAAGFAILLDCETAICGGFDFRFATEALPPPEMFVNLGDFRFLAAEKPGEAAERVGILISRSGGQAWVQIIRVGPPQDGAAVATASATALGPAEIPAPQALPDDMGHALETAGRVVLSDLAFPSGSAQLGEGEFASLAALAQYLARNPGRRVALVGHTDATGALDANIALSKRRAASVVERLVSAYGVPRQQVQAEGMGWLSPVAANLTAAGREANRRVEAVLISTE